MSNTFIQGTVPGSLNSSSEIKLLLVYLARKYEKSISVSLLTDCLCAAEIANYFEITSAIGNLTDSNHLVVDSDNFLCATTLSDALSPLFEDLPASIIDKAQAYIDEAIGHAKDNSGVTAKIIKTDSGFFVKCRLMDNDTILYETMVFAPSMEEAQLLKKSLCENLDKIYSYTVSFLKD